MRDWKKWIDSDGDLEHPLGRELDTIEEANVHDAEEDLLAARDALDTAAGALLEFRSSMQRVKASLVKARAAEVAGKLEDLREDIEADLARCLTEEDGEEFRVLLAMDDDAFAQHHARDIGYMLDTSDVQRAIEEIDRIEESDLLFSWEGVG